jgi:serine/threonine protein kinase
MLACKPPLSQAGKYRCVIMPMCRTRSISALFTIPPAHTHTCCLTPKKGCRDLLRRMLQANPAARASLDEVLTHPWMNPSAFRCPRMLLLGADSDVPKHAALKWPDQVDRKWFYRIAAIEPENGDDAWRSLAHALELVSQLCEACSGGDSRAHTSRSFTSHNRLSRELPDRALSLLARIRSRAVLEWSIQVSPLRKRRTKIVTI